MQILLTLYYVEYLYRYNTHWSPHPHTPKFFIITQCIHTLPYTTYIHYPLSLYSYQYPYILSSCHRYYTRSGIIRVRYHIKNANIVIIHNHPRISFPHMYIIRVIYNTYIFSDIPRRSQRGRDQVRQLRVDNGYTIRRNESNINIYMEESL